MQPSWGLSPREYKRDAQRSAGKPPTSQPLSPSMLPSLALVLGTLVAAAAAIPSEYADVRYPDDVRYTDDDGFDLCPENWTRCEDSYCVPNPLTCCGHRGEQTLACLPEWVPGSAASRAQTGTAGARPPRVFVADAGRSDQCLGNGKCRRNGGYEYDVFAIRRSPT